MILYAVTIFLSAFLLFLIQPIVAKQILPWFGGSAAVWTTCMVFFQVLLLAGYAYADWTSRKLTARMQVILHAALLVVSLLSLPIVPDAAWKPLGEDEPTLRILGLLGVTIGLPYFLLSTTGPLVQAWFARSFSTGTVYRLFALSNLGSLLALIAYPLLLEPTITTREQAYAWTAAYVVFVAVCFSSAVLGLRGKFVASAPVLQAMVEQAPRFGDYVMWLVLAAMGSIMLLSVTNHITQNIASIPFLWILPLLLYLLTFILCFEGRNWYKRIFFIGPVLIIIAAMAWRMQAERGVIDIKEEVPLFAAGLFVTCMFFHGELALRKPAPRFLTSFYLMVSLGGALGGVLVGLVAPKVFTNYYELLIALVATGLLVALIAWPWSKVATLAALGATFFTSYHVYQYFQYLTLDTRVMLRNFYGSLRVKDTGPETNTSSVRRLMHGTIMHGEQHLHPDHRQEPTTYYGLSSGIGVAIKHNNRPNQRVGVVGLGTGTLAVYGKKNDVYRFYDINPQVIRLAYEEFFFLPESRATIEVVLGDARLAMEREPPQAYDVLAIDAFSSDSIPVHLITAEAMALYLKHIKPDGIIAFHVSNRFLELAPVVEGIARTHGLPAALIVDEPQESSLSRTSWVLVTRDQAFLEHPQVARTQVAINEIPGLRVWTDDFNNLFDILK